MWTVRQTAAPTRTPWPTLWRAIRYAVTWGAIVYLCRYLGRITTLFRNRAMSRELNDRINRLCEWVSEEEACAFVARGLGLPERPEPYTREDIMWWAYLLALRAEYQGEPVH